MIAITVGGVNFVGVSVQLERGDLAELAQIGAGRERPALADLFDEFRAMVNFSTILSPLSLPLSQQSLVVDQDAVFLQRPLVAEIVAGATPQASRCRRPD